MTFTLYLLFLFLVLLLIGNISTLLFQDYFIFRPEKLEEGYAYEFLHPFEEHWVETPGGGRINLLWFRRGEGAGERVIVYHHGNMGSLKRWGHVYYHLLELGYDLIIYDYRGFGKSTGPRDEHRMQQDALAVYAFAERRYQAQNIVLYGRSLGSHFAAFVARNRPCRMLILETPFSNMRDLFHAYFPFLPRVFRFKYAFDNKALLPEIEVPIHIFHGTKDLVVPYKVAIKLKPLIKKTDTFTTIEDGRHGDLLFFDRFNDQRKNILL